MKDFLKGYKEAHAKAREYMRAAAKAGEDICTYCPDYNCRDCIVNEWKEDPGDE